MQLSTEFEVLAQGMLIQLTPEQITKGWPLVRPMLAQTLPPTLRVSTDVMTSVLAALMKEDAQFWVYYRKEGDGKPMAIVLTTIVHDKVASVAYLLIYSMYSLTPMSREDYLIGIEALKKFAAANRCQEVVAYVENDNFVRVLQSVGGVKATNLVRL